MRNLLVALFLLLAPSLVGQSRQSIRDVEYARQAMGQNKVGEAVNYLNKAIERDPDYRDAHLMLGELQLRQEQFDKALASFDHVLDLSPGYFLGLYRRGLAYYRMEDFERAIDDYEAYMKSEGASDRGKEEAEKYLAWARFGLDAKANPVPFDPINLGDSVNGPYMEYFPAVTADGKELIFTRNQPSPRALKEDFYVSRGGQGQWSLAEALDRQVNSDGNEGALCINADGNVAVFTACGREDGAGSCDLYMTIRENGTWGKPFNLGYPINTEAWESQPSLSPDGRTIYFTSNRRGGKGGKDLWKSTFEGGGEWGEPVNLGDSINTRGDEITPFMHWDGQSLYFASTGHPGIGDFDMYLSLRLDNDLWSSPQNLGYPINSVREENGLIVAPDGRTAYYSREGYADSRGMLDLYSFDLPKDVRAAPIAYVKGFITDHQSGKPLSATVEFVDVSTGETYLEMNTGSAGYYFSCLPGNRNYALNVRHPGYLFHSERFTLEESTENSARDLPVSLHAIETGASLTLRNVFFDSGSSELRGSSSPELDRTAEFLALNPSLIVEISGHTDNVGSQESNQALSEQRAIAVVNYLVNRGVPRERLKAVGYGASDPVASNETELGRQENRRTELKIIQN